MVQFSMGRLNGCWTLVRMMLGWSRKHSSSARPSTFMYVCAGIHVYTNTHRYMCMTIQGHEYLQPHTCATHRYVQV